MEDRRCWKLLVAVRGPPRGHSKTAKAMAAGDDDGDAIWRSTAGARGRARGRRPVRARSSSAGEGGTMARPHDL